MRSVFPRIFFATACCLLCTGADWTQFRGRDANGVSSDRETPDSLQQIAWKAELPGRGLSGPIVVSGRVYLTSSSGYRQDRLRVHCFDDESGEPLWERQFWATGRTQCHRKMCVATPTPATDGERIFAFYSSNDLACLDLDGNLLWYRGLAHDFPNASNSLGMASSPVVIGDTLVVQVESDAESFATGLDVTTGVSRWKIHRPQRANWTSPAILRGAKPDDDLVLLQSSAGVSAVEPRTGRVVWSYDDGASTIPSTAVVGETLYVPSNGITAMKAVNRDSTPQLLWRENRLAPSTASPLVYDERVFTLNRAGVLTAADVETGEPVWRLRLEGPFSGTPVAGGGKLFAFNEEGKGYVIRPSAKRGEIIDETELGETILCTPALAEAAVYVRSDEHLWKFTGSK